VPLLQCHTPPAAEHIMTAWRAARSLVIPRSEHLSLNVGLHRPEFLGPPVGLFISICKDCVASSQLRLHSLPGRMPPAFPRPRRAPGLLMTTRLPCSCLIAFASLAGAATLPFGIGIMPDILKSFVWIGHSCSLHSERYSITIRVLPWKARTDYPSTLCSYRSYYT